MSNLDATPAEWETFEAFLAAPVQTKNGIRTILGLGPIDDKPEASAEPATPHDD